MKRILLALSLALLIAAEARAQSVTDDLVGLGMSPELAEYIAVLLPAGTTMSNAAYLKGRNAGNSADVGLIRINATDDTEVASDSGDPVIIKPQTDANRSFTFNAASDAAHTVTFGDGGTTATQTLVISASTPDGDDDSTLTIAGGGADGAGRGASIVLGGEDLAGGGDLTLKAATADGILMNLGGTTRAFAFEASSDTAHTIKFGDAGTTAAQTLTISNSTSDADDDGSVAIAGGGSSANTRGAVVTAYGNEFTGQTGNVVIATGVPNGSLTRITVNAADNLGKVIIRDGNNTTDRFYLNQTGTMDVVSKADIRFNTSGGTIALQEATAADACSGTLTANGATPVVTSTTCATTGSRIFLSRTSAETGVVTAWVSALTNGVSFAITGEAGDTGTYNWIIFHEAP